MRKISYLASVLALSMAVFSTSCSKNNGDDAAKTDDSAQQSGTVAGQNASEVSKGHVTELSNHIRYIDSQRISMAYGPARDAAKADSAAQVKLASYQNTLASDLQRKQTAIEEKQGRGGYLTQESFNNDIADLQKAQQDAEKKLMQRQRELMVEVANKQEVVLDSIHSVIKYLSEQHKLDAVLEKAMGLYFNSALDMTDEVIAELNRRLGK